MELTPKTPFTTNGTTDQFRCFVLDPAITTPQYLTGHFIIPGNATVVHHAVFVSDPNREEPEARGRRRKHDCFAAPASPPAPASASGSPAGMPTEYAPNVGTPIAAGSLIVMQVHYHAGGASAAPDLTRVQMRLTPTKPDYYLFTLGIGNYTSFLANGDGLQAAPEDPPTGPEFPDSGRRDRTRRAHAAHAAGDDQQRAHADDVGLRMEGAHAPCRHRPEGGGRAGGRDEHVPLARTEVGFHLAADVQLRRADREPSGVASRRQDQDPLHVQQLVLEPPASRPSTRPRASRRRAI